MTDEDADRIADEIMTRVEQLVQYVQAAERVRAILPHIKTIAEEVESLHTLDNELAPELETVVNALSEAAQALERAFNFTSARMNVQLGIDD